MLRQVDNRKRKNQKDSETKLHVIASGKINRRNSRGVGHQRSSGFLREGNPIGYPSRRCANTRQPERRLRSLHSSWWSGAIRSRHRAVLTLRWGESSVAV